MTPEQNFILFDTAIGACAIIWNARGIVGVEANSGTVAATKARLKRRFPAAAEAVPTAAVQHAIDGVTALLAGVPRDLNELGPDWLELGVWLTRSLLRYAARNFSKENTVRRDSM